jgi:hypothetical protein
MQSQKGGIMAKKKQATKKASKARNAASQKTTSKRHASQFDDSYSSDDDLCKGDPVFMEAYVSAGTSSRLSSKSRQSG